MVEQLIQGVLAVFQLDTFSMVVLGSLIGLTIGVAPGVGGLVTLSLLLPVVYGMEPVKGLSFLLAAHAVTYTGGAITAILLNIPGTAISVATLIDGFPMTQQGKGSRAIGNALTASALGGIVGAVALALLIPAVRPIIMLIGLPETFFLILLAISLIAVISTGSLLKGLISGLFGIFISFIGMHEVTGLPRFDFDNIYLYDGIKLVPVALGLFALPQALDLMAKGESIAKVDKHKVTGATLGMLEGAKDIFRHWWLFLRSSIIGAVVGLIPGVGGESATFIAYAYAKQSSRHPERFGRGCEEGVIAPEAANNSKEGGALLPTLAFGLPGSAGMALLLGAFLILGITPGPEMLKEHLDVAFGLVVTLAVSNVIAVIFAFLFMGQLTKIAFIHGRYLGPVILVLVVIGSYSIANNVWDIMAAFIFGVLGYSMRLFGYSSPALILGFVLAPIAEMYFFLSLATYGSSFFLRPIPLVLVVLTILLLSSGWLRQVLNRRRKNI